MFLKKIIGNSINFVNENNLLEKEKDFFQNFFAGEYKDLFVKKDGNIKNIIKILAEKSIEDIQKANHILNLNLDYVDTFFEANKLFFFSKNYEEYQANAKKLLA